MLRADQRKDATSRETMRREMLNEAGDAAAVAHAVMVNGDPRGRALKLDDENQATSTITMYWPVSDQPATGRYFLLSPDAQGVE